MEAGGWLAAIIVAAILFDLTSGMNDASGMVAIATASRALSAVAGLWLAVSGILLAQVVASDRVARTLATEIVQLTPGDRHFLPILLAALAGALIWISLSRALGLPTSATHALVGGLIGTALIAGEPVHWNWPSLLTLRPTGVGRVVVALIVSPLLGMAAGYGLNGLFRWAFRYSSRQLVGLFNIIQAGLVLCQTFFYGRNDAQRSMSIVTGALVAGGWLPQFTVPLWVKALAVVFLSTGALLGSQRVLLTIGWRITRLSVVNGLAAQAGSVGTVALATSVGVPISSSQVVAASVAGSGFREEGHRVDIRILRDMALTWLLTLPGAGVAGGLVYLLVHALSMHG